MLCQREETAFIWYYHADRICSQQKMSGWQMSDRQMSGGQMSGRQMSGQQMSRNFGGKIQIFGDPEDGYGPVGAGAGGHLGGGASIRSSSDGQDEAIDTPTILL